MCPVVPIIKGKGWVEGVHEGATIRSQTGSITMHFSTHVSSVGALVPRSLGVLVEKYHMGHFREPSLWSWADGGTSLITSALVLSALD